MNKYRINGEVYEADSPEAAYAMAKPAKQQSAESNPYHPIHDMNSVEKFVSGMGRGAHNIGDTVGGWLGLTSEDDLAEQARLDAPLLATGAGSAGNMAGEIMATAPLGMGAGALVGRGVSALAPSLVRGSGVIGQGAGRGAVEGAVESTLVGGDVGSGAGIGGVVGGAVPAIGRVNRWMSKPANVSPEARAIQRLGEQQGIPADLTVGQMASPETVTGSLLRGTEEMINRMPGNTSLLRDRGNAVQNWNLAEIRQALPNDLAEQITTTGTHGMRQAKDALNGAYDDVLGTIKQGDVTLDQVALDALTGIEATAVSRLDEAAMPGAKKQINNLLDDLIENKMDGKNIKSWERRLREKAELAGKNGDGDLQDLFFDLREVVRTQRDSVLGPEGAARIREVDRGYAQMMPIRNASAKIGAVRRGQFTPDQLAAGAIEGESKWGKATGRNPTIDRANAANEVFGTTLPEVGPGTAEKLVLQGLIGGGIGTGLDLANGGDFSMSSPLLGAAGSIAAGKATPMLRNSAFGNTAVQGAMRSYQSPLEAILRGIRPYAVAAGASGEE